MVDFTLSPEIREKRAQVSVFMAEHIYPNEEALGAENDDADKLLKEIQQKVKQQGMWAMFIGPEAGGTGTGFLPYAYVNEILGRSPFAPTAFGCQAPDTGNAEIIAHYGTKEQKDRYLWPLLNIENALVISLLSSGQR